MRVHAAVLALVTLLLVSHESPAQVRLQAFYGDGESDYFGRAVANAGDVDADGTDDLIVGAVRYARVFSGRDGALLHQLEVFDHPQVSMSNDFGMAVDGAGDVDGDGHDDLVVGDRAGEFLNGLPTGAAWIFSGLDGSVLHVFIGQAFSMFGTSVAGAGDVDGYQLDDIIVGAPQNEASFPGLGYVSVLSAAGGGQQLYNWPGCLDDDKQGFKVGTLGDVNGDGRPDLFYTGPDASVCQHRYINVRSGLDGSLLFSVFENAANVAEAGDFDADGIGDLIAGFTAPLCPWPANHAVVRSGVDGDILHTFPQPAAQPCSFFGSSVRGAGDVDGDGHGDVIIGAQEGYPGPGYAHVYSGLDGGLLFEVTGEADVDHFGDAVAGLGDLDGDGRAEVVVGAWLNDLNALNAGAAYVYTLSPWTDLGSGLAGTNGVPLLEGAGALVSGETVTLSLSGALEDSSAAMVIGVDAINAPFKGGTLVPAVSFLLLGLPTDAAGALQLVSAWPGGAPPGLSVYVQDWITDPAGPVGYAASNALRGTTP